MGHLLQENVPKLLPMWHDLSVQDLAQIKSHKRYFQDKLPDFGGTGVDISTYENNRECSILKRSTDEISFGAHICSLPFFPPRNVFLNADPCLIPVKASNSNIKKFCVALEYLRRCANKPDGKFEKELLSCHKIAKRLCKKQSKKKLEKFSVPDTVLQLAAEFPKSFELHEANFDYNGGCLTSSQTTEGNHVLLHPVGKGLNKLGITPLVEIYDPDKAYQPAYLEMKTVKLKSNCIQKIRSAFPGHCLVQQGQIYQYVNFSNYPHISTHQLLTKDTSYVNIAASPYNPTEFVSINDKGILQHQSIDSKEPLWISDKVLNLKQLKYTSLKGCAFGSHPKLLLSLLEDSVCAYDLRIAAKRKSIILSEHFSSFPDEKFLNLTNLAGINPFQHLISSSSHLYVCDERYPKNPVLIWSHLFKSFPLYCDVASYDLNNFSSDAIVLLGSQESRELSVFTLRSQDSQIQPISLSTPLFLSSSSDFIDSLKLHGIDVNDDLVERIMNPLIGVCSLPHSKRKGFTAFQLTSLGDVFYQDYYSNSSYDSEHTYRVDTGCILSSPERILPHVSKWMDFSFKSSTECSSSRSNLINISIDLKDILSDYTAISSGCELCNSNAYSCDKEVISTDICSSCGLDNLEVQKSLDAFNNLGILAGPVVENSELESFDTTSLWDFKDDFSEKILKHWGDSENIGKSSPNYDYDSDSRLSFDSSKSGAKRSSISKNLSDTFDATQCSDISASQLSSHNETLQKETTDFTFPSQDSFEEFVPPSQDFRPVIGETLRTPKIKNQVKSRSSFAGF